MEQQNQNQAADTEFSRCAVPADQRKTYFSLTIVWTGFVFVITSMMAGGGLAAGMDKDGKHVTAFGGLGFGHVEIGTITPLAQPGNPKPRLFRLIPAGGIVNRMG